MIIEIEYLLSFIESKIISFENQLYDCIKTIYKSNNFEETYLIFDRIYTIKTFLDSIYISFNIELKEVFDQRIWKKNKMTSILSDFDRIDDLETRKYLYNNIKKWFYN